MLITDITSAARTLADFTPQHELVLRGVDRAVGYDGIIAIHNTTRGTAVGGTRIWSYATEDTAIVDALRLSYGMTLKNALAGLPFGGGKSVIMAPRPGVDREAILRAHGRFVNAVDGRYITAEDVGTSVDDMEIIALETRWVAGRRSTTGDPSPYTARGVVRAIDAAVACRLGRTSLGGLTIGMQGLGNVGREICAMLLARDARVIGVDVAPERMDAARSLGAHCLSDPAAIYDADIDVFCPCALGGVLNAETIPRLRARVVAGAANNQLWEDAAAADLAARGIVYVPDFVANAGGVISGSAPAMSWSHDEMLAHVDGIFETTMRVLESATVGRVDPNTAARHMVASILGAGRE